MRHFNATTQTLRIDSKNHVTRFRNVVGCGSQRERSIARSHCFRQRQPINAHFDFPFRITSNSERLLATFFPKTERLRRNLQEMRVWSGFLTHRHDGFHFRRRNQHNPRLSRLKVGVLGSRHHDFGIAFALNLVQSHPISSGRGRPSAITRHRNRFRLSSTNHFEKVGGGRNGKLWIWVLGHMQSHVVFPIAENHIGFARSRQFVHNGRNGQSDRSIAFAFHWRTNRPIRQLRYCPIDIGRDRHIELATSVTTIDGCRRKGQKCSKPLVDRQDGGVVLRRSLDLSRAASRRVVGLGS